MHKKGALSVTSIFATLGVVLITIGVLWLLASNWHQIPAFLKIIILVAATGLAYFLGYKLEKEHAYIAQTLYMLTAILWTLSLFLIAQIYNLTTTLQANANILGIATVGTIAFAYLLKSSPALVVAIFSFWHWVMLQTLASAITLEADALGMAFPLVILNNLAVTGVLFGTALIHRPYNQKFARVYTWWAAFSAFALGFWLSNQLAQYFIPDFWNLPATMMLWRLALPIAVIAIGIYLSTQKAKISKFDVWSGTLIWLAYLAAITIVPKILGTESNIGGYGGSLWTMSGQHIIQWLIFNVLFIAIVLIVINFATKEKRNSLVHLALWFFIAYIAIRYIGFIADLTGYLAMSTLFIIGGIGLILLAWLLNKFRKTTLQKLK
jgi:uncharacterized membrane protein